MVTKNDFIGDRGATALLPACDTAAKEGKPAGAPRRVLVSGSSGLVGRALVPYLQAQGHEVVRLVRRQAQSVEELRWDPEAGGVDWAGSGEFAAVVHLAGAGIAEGRWTEARRRAIRESRVRGTRLLAEALAARGHPPRVVIGGSAIGFYGDGGEAWLDETSPAGEGFLAQVTQAWEAAWAPLDGLPTRRVYLRTGMVLSAKGGALAKMLTPFSLGLGGPLGNGRQWWSWISLEDLLGIINRVLEDETLSGPLNAVGPEPVTSAEFARVLGRVLKRPSSCPVPAWALRFALGRGLADELLLASQRVRPGKLQLARYPFLHEKLEEALRKATNRLW